MGAEQQMSDIFSTSDFFWDNVNKDATIWLVLLLLTPFYSPAPILPLTVMCVASWASPLMRGTEH